MSKTEGLCFKAVITVKPDVQIEKYKGLKYKPKSVKITKEDIEEEIQKIRAENARIVPVEGRPAWNGDTVVIDFEGFMDGVPFDGGSAQDFSLKLGAKQFIAGFEEKIVGHSKGEDFEIEVAFPVDYPKKDFAQKDAVFKIKIHEIKGEELPKVDEEFVKDVSEFDTLEEFRKDLEEKLKERKNIEAERSKEDQLAEQLVALLKAEIPSAMIENRIDDEERNFSQRLKSQGVDIKDYLAYNNISKDDLRGNLRPYSENQVKLGLALEKIAELENIELTEEEIEGEYQKLAKYCKVDVEKIKMAVRDSDIAKDVAVGKAMNLVKDEAKVSK
jgi:trigger factor